MRGILKQIIIFFTEHFKKENYLHDILYQRLILIVFCVLMKGHQAEALFYYVKFILNLKIKFGAFY